MSILGWITGKVGSAMASNFARTFVFSQIETLKNLKRHNPGKSNSEIATLLISAKQREQITGRQLGETEASRLLSSSISLVDLIVKLAERDAIHEMGTMETSDNTSLQDVSQTVRTKTRQILAKKGFTDANTAF